MISVYDYLHGKKMICDRHRDDCTECELFRQGCKSDGTCRENELEHIDRFVQIVTDFLWMH